MSIFYQLINNKKDWEQFVTNHPQANFLQSYNWGLFSKRIGKKFFPLAFFQKKNDVVQQVAATMIIKEEAKRGDYLTIAGGPILNWKKPVANKLFSYIAEKIYQIAQQEKCYFVRVRPQAEATPSIKQLFAKNGFSPAPMHLTADLTLRLDITQSNDDLLAQMRKNTRYEIRKADRVSVSTKIVTDPKFMEEFYQHQLYLAEKHGFIPFPHDFLLKQFETFLADDQVAFINSYHEDQLLASAFVIFYQKEAVYHYGVSTPANLKLPGSYATQWRAIQEAKKRGCTRYNFWGVSPEDQKDHRFAGPSLFKRGFGGYELQHLPAHDLPTSRLYLLIKFFELIRKKIRGL